MLVHWIWFSHRPKLTDYSKQMLLRHFQDPEEIYYAESSDYSRVEELKQEEYASLMEKELSEAEKILEQCGEKGLKILTYGDAGYPERLRNIPDPPMVLYYRGTLPDFSRRPAIGVVGTRKASVYGLSTARRMGYQIARCGGIVVSGMARGIDANAMEGALTADCPTVGVLGCGADLVYPLSNRKLFQDVERYGCILSEFAPGTEPFKWNFPRRNRIISGLSNGVLVVEAPAKSGALITAGQALDQGRDVFVIPGNVDQDGFVGSNRLAREGAVIVSCGWDVMSEYEALYPDMVHQDTEPETAFSDRGKGTEQSKQEPPFRSRHGEKKQDVKKKLEKKAIDKSSSGSYSDVNTLLSRINREEQAVVLTLQGGERLVDDVIAETGLTTGKILAVLTMLELKGIIRRLPGKRISLK